MKKILYSIVCLFFVFNCFVFAQETTQSPTLKNEISVSTSNLNLNNLSLKYSKNISDDLWFKIGLIDLYGSVHSKIPSVGAFKTTDTQINGGLLIGIEKQKSITSRLAFFYGLNAQMTYNYSNQTTENPSVPESQRDNKVFCYFPGIGIDLGFFYKLNENFLLGVEVNPSIDYYFENNTSSYYTTNPYKSSGFDFSLGNNVALVTLKYRF